MNRKYITGWFSPNEPDLMVVFYQVEREAPAAYEAEVMRSGSVVQTHRDSNLARLQSDVTGRWGGDPGHVHPQARPPQARSRSWLDYLRGSRDYARVRSESLNPS